jgi:hypothetical protein
MPDQTTTKQLILRTQGGFANRLRAIVSAILWAEDLDRKLVIYWPVEAGHMPCSLEELLVPSSIPSLCCVHAGYISHAHQVLGAEDMNTMIQMCGESDEIRIESYSEFHPEVRSKRGILLLRNIRVQPSIENQAEKIWGESGAKSSTTAIHFRGTDHRKCLAASPLQEFIRRIDSEIKENSQSKYILCTDEVDASKQCKEVFAIDTPCLIKGRRTQEQQILGVVDWLLLQKCQRILASAGSSFSELAALRSGSQLETIHL